MDSFFNILRKFLVGGIAVIFTFVVLYVPQNYAHLKTVHEAEAQIGGGPVTEIGKNLFTNLMRTLKETSLDAIAYQVAKTFISQMLQSTIIWINSGFKGSPAFIQDLERFLLDTADIAAGEYIKGLGELGSIICRPFRIDIQLALALKYQKAREGKEVDECTLSGIVDNIERFIDGSVAREDFWEQWIEVTSKPRTYTPYGQMLEAEAQMGVYINGKKVIASKELDWGSGFLSSKVCESVAGPNGPEQKCVISTPGQTISASLNKALGTGWDQLIAADEINEVVSALVGQIANQALTGAAGLLGLSVRGGGGGGNGASYVNSLVEETQSSSGQYFNQGVEEIADRLAIQIEYRNLAIEYIPRLLAVSNNRSASQTLRDRAQLSYGDAVMVRDDTTGHIAKLQPLVDRYRALETEYATATDARKQAIRQEQSTIITRGIQYESYTKDRLQLSKREWADIVR